MSETIDLAEAHRGYHNLPLLEQLKCQLVPLDVLLPDGTTVILWHNMTNPIPSDRDLVAICLSAKNHV